MTSASLYLAAILIVAKVGGDLAERLGQPAVLGELLGGLLLGNLVLLGFDGLDAAKSDVSVDLLARLGLLILLFEVGLETTVPLMRKVGWSALFVAGSGMLATFLCGWGLAKLIVPQASTLTHAFLGASLCATSVGITARVLKDMGQSQSPTARVILGAAAVDDVLALVLLAVMQGSLDRVGGDGFPWAGIGAIVVKAALFFGVSMAVGVYLSLKLFKAASKLPAPGVLLSVGLVFCFFMAWIAGAIGLAPLIGAFAAGVILEDLHNREFVQRGERPLVELVQPLSHFMVPIFFVIMGMRTDLRTLLQPGTIPLALGLTLAVLLGQQACSLLARGPGVKRLAVGLGMLPRGEVSLIYAGLGLSLLVGGKPLLDSAAYSAIVFMVVLTTLLTPMTLRWSLGRSPV